MDDARQDVDPNQGLDHEPVLREEVIRYLSPRPGDTIVDCTVGCGGHSKDILLQLRGEGRLIGVDISSESLRAARRRIETVRTHSIIQLVQGNFANLATLLSSHHLPPSGGILLDLGLSTPQLLSSRLGLSWDSEEALDMRLDPESGEPGAADLLTTENEDELARIFRENADEKWSRRIARRIVETRKARPVRTGKDLGELVAGAIPRKAWPKKIHPATRAFMALRMEVNREIENLEAVLPQAVDLLRPGGRLVVISFHSGEDRVVKRFFKKMAEAEEPPWPLPQSGGRPAPLRILTPRPVMATEEEVRRNPPSRTARLRAAEKI